MEETTAGHSSVSQIFDRKRHVVMVKLTLGDEAVEVLVVGALKTQVATADVVNGLVVDHEGAVRVLEGSVGGEDRVVRLNDRGGGLRGGVDAEFELALLSVVDRETLHEESAETRAGTTTE